MKSLCFHIFLNDGATLIESGQRRANGPRSVFPMDGTPGMRRSCQDFRNSSTPVIETKE
jgi:hypothetical protein